MMRGVACLLCVLLLASCAEPEVAAPYQPVRDLKHTMSAVLEPAADIIWDSAGAIITAEGEQDLAPTTDEGWANVVYGATVVAETGNLLMMPGRARDNADWIEFSAGLTAMGEKAIVAAEAKDADALFEVGGELYNVCVACHQIYWTEGNSRFERTPAE